MAQLTRDELLYTYFVGRSQEWRQRLDLYEDQTIANLESVLDNALKKIARELKKKDLSYFQAGRVKEIEREIKKISEEVQLLLTGNISDIATEAAIYGLDYHYKTLSFNGAAAGVFPVNVGSTLIKTIINGYAFNGRVLSDWIESAFTNGVERKVIEAIESGLIVGDGYKKIVSDILATGSKITKQDAISLARTYVQTASNVANEAVYKKNKDIIQVVKWSAVLEKFDYKTGTGTCQRCAALDGNEYEIDEERPPCPLHIRCRCHYLPVVAWERLGLNMKTIRDIARPYTIRDPKNIDAGGDRTIQEVGMRGGSYSDWFNDRSSGFQQTVMGPGRYELFSRGKITFKDLVNPKTGELRSLAELRRL